MDNNKTSADVDPQVRAVLGRDELTAHDHERATEPVVGLILRAAGWARRQFNAAAALAALSATERATQACSK